MKMKTLILALNKCQANPYFGMDKYLNFDNSLLIYLVTLISNSYI
jgi:hypothetical protein